MEQIIVKPTIADFIRKLQEYPQEFPFRVEDADTNWIFDNIHLDLVKNILILSIDYSDEHSNFDDR